MGNTVREILMQLRQQVLCRGLTTIPLCWVTKSKSARCQLRSFTESVELQKHFERDYFSHGGTKKVPAVA
jgi:hypothetical protein